MDNKMTDLNFDNKKTDKNNNNQITENKQTDINNNNNNNNNINCINSNNNNNNNSCKNHVNCINNNNNNNNCCSLSNNSLSNSNNQIKLLAILENGKQKNKIPLIVQHIILNYTLRTIAAECDYNCILFIKEALAYALVCKDWFKLAKIYCDRYSLTVGFKYDGYFCDSPLVPQLAIHSKILSAKYSLYHFTSIEYLEITEYIPYIDSTFLYYWLRQFTQLSRLRLTTKSTELVAELVEKMPNVKFEVHVEPYRNFHSLLRNIKIDLSLMPTSAVTNLESVTIETDNLVWTIFGDYDDDENRYFDEFIKKWRASSIKILYDPISVGNRPKHISYDQLFKIPSIREVHICEPDFIDMVDLTPMLTYGNVQSFCARVSFGAINYDDENREESIMLVNNTNNNIIYSNYNNSNGNGNGNGDHQDDDDEDDDSDDEDNDMETNCSCCPDFARYHFQAVDFCNANTLFDYLNFCAELSNNKILQSLILLNRCIDHKISSKDLEIMSDSLSNALASNTTLSRLGISCDILSSSFYETMSKLNKTIVYLQLGNMNIHHFKSTMEMLTYNETITELDITSFNFKFNNNNINSNNNNNNIDLNEQATELLKQVLDKNKRITTIRLGKTDTLEIVYKNLLYHPNIYKLDLIEKSVVKKIKQLY